MLVESFETLTLKLGAQIVVFLLGCDFPLGVVHRAGACISGGGLAEARAQLAIGLTFHTAIH